VVGADFRRVGNLLHREVFRFARRAQLFGDRWHSFYLACLKANWQQRKFLNQPPRHKDTKNFFHCDLVSWWLKNLSFL
jgi:hypothetical protein